MGLVGSFPDFLGTIPGWITALSASGGFGLLLRWHLGLKKVAVEAEQVQIEGQKVRNEAADQLRDHWADEIKRITMMLADQEKRHNDALDAMEQRHGKALLANEERQAKCEQERERLARKVGDMEEELRGVRAQVRMNSADQLRLLAATNEDIPPYALEAAQTIVQRARRKKDH
jgi:rubrerythrin